VVVPAEITCCGFAGDKGLVTPELNASALKGLAEQVDELRRGLLQLAHLRDRPVAAWRHPVPFDPRVA
jgi:hypothetical protein